MPPQDADPANWWSETFLSHTDSKPKGPEGISLDLAFPGAAHVYGIPERATHLALAPTAGSGVESEPYRCVCLGNGCINSCYAGMEFLWQVQASSSAQLCADASASVKHSSSKYKQPVYTHNTPRLYNLDVSRTTHRL